MITSREYQKEESCLSIIYSLKIDFKKLPERLIKESRWLY